MTPRVKPEVAGYATTVMDHWPGWTTPLAIDRVLGCWGDGVMGRTARADR